ncbi:MAG: calcium-binding protein [Xanthobacteraceae bacterium]
MAANTTSTYGKTQTGSIEPTGLIGGNTVNDDTGSPINKLGVDALPPPGVMPGLVMEGTGGNDRLIGSNLADEMHGFGGHDQLFGAGGDDRMFGDAGNDILDGGSGNDFLVGGLGADRFIGGIGTDTVSYAAATAGIELNLNLGYGFGGEASGDTFQSIERIVGSNYRDILAAGQTAAVLDGGAGNDLLAGGGGTVSQADTLQGGNGNDTLIAGDRTTWMAGGSGADTFLFGFTPALVADFEAGVDKIDAWPVNMWDGPFGHDGVLATGTAVPSEAAADRDGFFYDTDDYRLYHLQYFDDGGMEAKLQATFLNGVQLQASDFITI